MVLQMFANSMVVAGTAECLYVKLFMVWGGLWLVILLKFYKWISWISVREGGGVVRAAVL